MKLYPLSQTLTCIFHERYACLIPYVCCIIQVTKLSIFCRKRTWWNHLLPHTLEHVFDDIFTWLLHLTSYVCYTSNYIAIMNNYIALLCREQTEWSCLLFRAPASIPMGDVQTYFVWDTPAFSVNKAIFIDLGRQTTSLTRNKYTCLTPHTYHNHNTLLGITDHVNS